MRGEVKYRGKNNRMFFIAGLLFLSNTLFGQKDEYRKQFSLKDNVMYITLSKNLSTASLDSFVRSYNLNDIGLFTLLLTGKTDSLEKSDWKLESNSNTNPYYVLTKRLGKGSDLKKSADRMAFSSIPTPDNWRVVGGNRVIYGANKFKNNKVFRQEDNITYFILTGYQNAKSVRLAGNFTNWQHGAFPLTKTEEGWIAPVRLAPGKVLL
jgi:hypothetical protein